MTTNVMVVHTGGNQKVKVVIEQWLPEKPPIKSGDTSRPAGWYPAKEYILYSAGNLIGGNHDLVIYDTQRIRVEEYIEQEKKVD